MYAKILLRCSAFSARSWFERGVKFEKDLIDIFSFCRKDDLKKISFYHLLNIFLLYRKDDLKKTFSYLIVFCAVWIDTNVPQAGWPHVENKGILKIYARACVCVCMYVRACIYKCVHARACVYFKQFNQSASKIIALLKIYSCVH